MPSLMKIRLLAFHNQLPYYLHIDNTNAVLPIAGLAAIIIKSLGCQPEVILSNFQNLWLHHLPVLQFLQFSFFPVILNFGLFQNFVLYSLGNFIEFRFSLINQNIRTLIIGLFNYFRRNPNQTSLYEFLKNN
jgi:hypothetical protein